MGGRVVEGTGLENRQARKRLEGSNPSPSASIHPLRESRKNEAWTPLRATFNVQPHGDLIVVGAPHPAFVDIRRRLTASQSLIDLAAGTLEAAPAPGN